MTSSGPETLLVSGLAYWQSVEDRTGARGGGAEVHSQRRQPFRSSERAASRKRSVTFVKMSGLLMPQYRHTWSRIVAITSALCIKTTSTWLSLGPDSIRGPTSFQSVT